MSLRRRNISLGRRLFLMLLPALGILLTVINVGGGILISEYLENAQDQVLRGSVLAIAEKTDLIKDTLEVDIPSVAFAMLRTPGHDSIFYNVLHGDTVITGYPDMPRPDEEHLILNGASYRTGTYKGQSIRIATFAKRLYGDPVPAVIQVAQTTRSSQQAKRLFFTAFALCQIALVAVTWLVITFGIRRGLMPLTDLKQKIKARTSLGPASFSALPTTGMPRELLPVVSSFNTLLSSLEASFENNRRFTSNASHQMRTPLSVVRTHLELLDRAELSSDNRAILDDIESGVSRLERLLTQLITLARAEEYLVPVAGLQKVNVCNVATQVMVDLVPAALQKNIALEFDDFLEGAAAFVWGTDILIENLIANLLDNAIRYTPDGGSVTLKLYRINSDLRIEIEDSGSGIPAEYRERVFERFFRMPNNRNQFGSGLGLAIVLTICNLLDGSVVLTDRIKGSGLRTILTFPLISDHGSPAPPTPVSYPAYRLPFWEKELKRTVSKQS